MKMKPYRVDNVRLAAKALLEWKTPIESEFYRKVLDELLTIHPFAVEMGLHHSHPALMHDYQSVLFSYLVETLNVSGSERGTEPDLKERYRRVSDLVAQFFQSATVDVLDYYLWPDGPLHSQVADAIANGLSRHDESAEWALFSLIIPLS